jgi:membrane protease YdiL (CAAX protease family)
MKTSALVFLCLFLGLRIALDPIIWAKLHPYLAYGFEAFLIAAALWAFRSLRPWRGGLHKQDAGLGLILLIGGAIIHAGAVGLEIGVPYDLTDPQTLVFLLLLAPLIEEFLFRFVLWESLTLVKCSKLLQLQLTALAFSLSHFMAVFSLPEAIAPFVYYQSIYVVALALLIGLRRQQGGSIWSAVFLHFCFNLGFYLGVYL